MRRVGTEKASAAVEMLQSQWEIGLEKQLLFSAGRWKRSLSVCSCARENSASSPGAGALFSGPERLKIHFSLSGQEASMGPAQAPRVVNRCLIHKFSATWQIVWATVSVLEWGLYSCEKKANRNLLFSLPGSLVPSTTFVAACVSPKLSFCVTLH